MDFVLCSLLAWTFALVQHRGGFAKKEKKKKDSEHFITVLRTVEPAGSSLVLNNGTVFWRVHCYSGTCFHRASWSCGWEKEDRWAYTNVLVFTLNTPSLFLTNSRFLAVTCGQSYSCLRERHVAYSWRKKNNNPQTLNYILQSRRASNRVSSRAVDFQNKLSLCW